MKKSAPHANNYRNFSAPNKVAQAAKIVPPAAADPARADVPAKVAQAVAVAMPEEICASCS